LEGVLPLVPLAWSLALALQHQGSLMTRTKLRVLLARSDAPQVRVLSAVHLLTNACAKLTIACFAIAVVCCVREKHGVLLL
jgi:hypothetical protein